MDFDQAILNAEDYASKNPAQRRGQAFYNYFYTLRPEVVHSTAATKYDPFYNDERLSDFLAFVGERW